MRPPQSLHIGQVTWGIVSEAGRLCTHVIPRRRSTGGEYSPVEQSDEGINASHGEEFSPNLVDLHALTLRFLGDVVEINHNIPTVATTAAVMRLPQVILPGKWKQKQVQSTWVEDTPVHIHMYECTYNLYTIQDITTM